MPESQIPLIKGDKIGIETDYRDALPQNMYAVERKILGASGYMIEYPGLTKFTDGIGIDRGANYNERFDKHYRLSGNKLISISRSGIVTELGTIPGASQSRMIGLYSFNTQGIIADGNFFLYSITGGLNQVTDPDVGAPIDGVWVDGYYFLTDGEYLYHTEIADETAINALSFATAEFMPDPSLGLSKTQDNKVVVWGRYTVEYLVDVATDNFAFTRIASRAQKIGIVATHAKCETKGIFYITGGYRDESVAVYAVNIGQSVKVSTREIEKIIAKYTEPELVNMRMETRTENDTTFIIIHLPGETLCFNEKIAQTFGKENAWAILKSGIIGESNYRAINGVLDARLSRWVYGDKRDSKIGFLDNDVCTHYGELTEWILYTPFINVENYSIDEIAIETIPGHTTALDATVAFSLTYNGVTYSSEWWNLYGEPHEYGQRFILRRIGYCGDWVGFKLRGASTSRMAFALMKMVYS